MKASPWSGGRPRQVVALFISIVAVLAALLASPRPGRQSNALSSLVATPSATSADCLGPRGPVAQDWNEPVVGDPVASFEQAAPHLGFQGRMPQGLGNSTAFFLTPQADQRPKDAPQGLDLLFASP